MAEAMHPLAPHHLPGFITPPGETDPFLTGAAIFLVVIILLLGSLYFRLHALPEKIAHRGASHQQFQLVAVLSLLALFTHNNVFWVAALLLAFIPIPDFWAPLANMAESLGRMANRRSQSVAQEVAEGASFEDNLSQETVTPQTQLMEDYSATDNVTPRPLLVPGGMTDKAASGDKAKVDDPRANLALSHLSAPLTAGDSKP